MLKNLLLFSFLGIVNNFVFSQVNIVVKPLPGGPITQNGVEFLHCRLISNVNNPNAECDVTFAISEVEAEVYNACGASVRFKNDWANSGGDGIHLDARNGTWYESNSDELIEIQYDIDYFIYFLLDIPSHKYSVYARTEKMTELYTLLDQAAYRNIPSYAFEYSSMLSQYDSITNPVLRIKDFKAISPLKFATEISIGTVPTINLNVPVQLNATIVPADANAGIAWKVVKGDSYATISSDGKITVLKDTIIDVEAYAVTMKDQLPVMATAKLNNATGIAQNSGNFNPIKLSPTLSTDGYFSVQVPENLTKKISYKVYSVYGQEIKSGHVDGNKMYIGTTKSGVYFVRFSSGLINQTVEVLIK